MNLFKSISVYLVSNVISTGLPFLLLPVFTMYLDPSDYGNMSLVLVFITFVSPMIVAGIHNAISAEFFRTPDRTTLAHYVTAAMIIPLMSFLLLMTIVTLGGYPFFVLSGVTPEWSKLSLMIAFLQVTPMVVQYLLQAMKKPFAYGAYQVGLAATSMAVAVLLIAGFHYRWQGRMFGLLLSNAVFTFGGLVYLWRAGFLSSTFRWSDAVGAFKFSVFLIPNELGSVLVLMANRILIAKVLNIEVLGLYAVAYQVATAVMMVALSFNQAWMPFLFGTLTDGNEARKRTLVRLSYLAMAGFVLLGLLMEPVGLLMYKFFINDKFSASQPLVLWISLSFACTGLYYVVVNYMIFARRTRMLAAISMGGGVFSLGLTYLTLQYFGIEGAVRAMVLSNGLLFLAAWVGSQRAFPMPWLNALRRQNV